MRVLLVGLLLAAGCAAPSAPPLSVSLDQSRDLENRHLLAVGLVNEGDTPVQVVRLQLRSGAWSTVAPTVREELLAPGRRLAFPLTYGRADCRGSGPALVVVGYRRDGVLREARVRVPDDRRGGQRGGHVVDLVQQLGQAVRHRGLRRTRRYRRARAR